MLLLFHAILYKLLRAYIHKKIYICCAYGKHMLHMGYMLSKMKACMYFFKVFVILEIYA